MSDLHDAELQQFMNDLELSLRQAQAGDFARVHTPEQIAARRKAEPRPSTTLKASQFSAACRAAHR